MWKFLSQKLAYVEVFYKNLFKNLRMWKLKTLKLAYVEVFKFRTCVRASFFNRISTRNLRMWKFFIRLYTELFKITTYKNVTLPIITTKQPQNSQSLKHKFTQIFLPNDPH